MRRMARPGTRFASCSATGRRKNAPTTMMPAVVKPPNPTITSGREARISRAPNLKACNCRQTKRQKPAGLGEKGAPGIRSNLSCGYFPIRRASTFLWLMRSVVSWPARVEPFRQRDAGGEMAARAAAGYEKTAHPPPPVRPAGPNAPQRGNTIAPPAAQRRGAPANPAMARDGAVAPPGNPGDISAACSLFMP